MGNPAGLLKIGKPEHIARLRRLGHLYMRPLHAFAAEEDDTGRGDGYEGASYIWQPDKAQLKIQREGAFHPIPGITGPLRYASAVDRNTNIFSMYAIRDLDVPTRLDERNRTFGDHFAYVTHVDEFLDRVLRAVPPQASLQSGFVEYFDSNLYTGPVAPFRKRREFEHQREFRLAIAPGTGQVLELDVGDLSDILIVGQTQQVAGVNVKVVSG